MFHVSWRRCLRWTGVPLLGVVALAIGPVAGAQAATYTVNDTADLALAPSSPAGSCAAGSTTCTLRAAVQSADVAGGSSTITVPAGTYQLTIPSTASDDPSSGDLDIQSDVTISGSGSSATIIDANSVDRAFTVQPGATLAVSGVTIENGSPSASSTDGDRDGGAIDDEGSGLLSVTGVVFHDNAAAEQGGAIALSGGTADIAGSTFVNNSTGEGGGAIFTTADFLNIHSDTFSDNSAYDFGGAIAASTGDLDVEDSTFSDNTSQFAGGAIRLYLGADHATVDHSTFSGNKVLSGSNSDPSDGGAIQNLAGFLAADDDLFTQNSAGSEGGAIFLAPQETSSDGNQDEPESFQDDEFDDNTAGQDGGALAWALGALTIGDSSFIDNTTPQSGGAIAADLNLASGPGFLWTMSNTTLADNSAASGGGIWFDYSGIPVSWDNDTIAFNHAAGEGGGELQGGGVANAADATSSGGTGVSNTLIADNGVGDCGDGDTPAATTDEFSAADTGYNLDSDGTCFSDTVTGDDSNASATLSQPADNGGPLAGNAGTETLQTVAELSGSASIGAGAGCETNDERGVSRAGPCDIGAYQAAAAALALTGSAPAAATQGEAFQGTFTVTDTGPAPSTGTALSIPLPTGVTAYAASSSQGACTESATLVSCSLGNISSGAPATVTLVLSDANSGIATLIGTATNAQDGSSTNTETTTISTPATNTQGGSSTVTETTTTSAPTATVTEPPPPTVNVAKPSARTGKASKLAKRSANLAGTYTVGSQTTLVFFQYGTSKSFGSTTNPVSKTKNGSSSATLKRLKANTTYHYRLVAINASGVAYGKSKTLKTKRTKRQTSLPAASRARPAEVRRRQGS